MNKTWKPIAAGVLDIIGGAVQLLVTIWVSIYIIIAGHTVEGVPILGATFGFTGILAIVGGVYALRRKKWGLALAGSFTAFFPNILYILLWRFLFFNIRIPEMLFTPLLLLGITVIILIVLSKKEFRGSTELAKSVKARDYAGKKLHEEIKRIKKR